MHRADAHPAEGTARLLHATVKRITGSSEALDANLLESSIRRQGVGAPCGIDFSQFKVFDVPNRTTAPLRQRRAPSKPPRRIDRSTRELDPPEVEPTPPTHSAHLGFIQPQQHFALLIPHLYVLHFEHRLPPSKLHPPQTYIESELFPRGAADGGGDTGLNGRNVQHRSGCSQQENQSERDAERPPNRLLPLHSVKRRHAAG